MKNDSKMIKVGGLWQGKRKKNGEFYLSGKFGFFTKLVILKNDYKEKPSDPDYMMFIAESKRPSEDSEFEDVPPISDDDSDIPF